MLLLVAACSGEPAATAPGHAKADEATIECARGGSAQFARDCTVERVHAGKGEQVIVRHPGGSFRRFDVLTDGKGLATADGAQAAQVAVGDGGVEVTVGNDRYRFTATVVNHGSQ